MKNKIITNKLLWSISITLISFILCLAINSFRISTSGDDYGMSLFISQGDCKNLFVNYFLLLFLIPLQHLLPSINVFVLLQLLMNIVSFIIVYYTIFCFEKAKSINKILSCILISVLFSSFAFVFIQWTISAVIVSTSGYLILLFAFCKKKSIKKSSKIICCISGFLLLMYGSMLRMESFLVVSFIFAIIIICELVIKAKDIWIKNREIVNTLVLLIKRYGTILVSFVIIFSLLTSLFLVSTNIKSSLEGYIEYNNYNSARSSLVDFDFAQYNGNESFYNSIDIYSQNDLDIYKNWCLDSDFFTTERMKKIVDYSKQPSINPRFNLTLIYNLICNKLSMYVPINPIIVLFVVFLIVIGLLLLLIVNRNKMKFCFPILYTIMWVVFFCVFRISTANFLIQIFALISTITIYVFNRNYYFKMLALSLSIISIYTYLAFNRVLFRTVFTFAFPALIILIFSAFLFDYKRKINIKIKVKPMIKVFSTIAISVLVVFCGVKLWGVEVSNKDHSEIYNYVLSNPNNIYVSGPGQGMSAWFNDSQSALFTYKIPQNVIINAGWIDGSEYDQKLRSKYEIKKLYEELINSDNMYYITTEGCAELLTQYYNDHYSIDNQRIYFVLQDKLGDSCVYKVVSK